MPRKDIGTVSHVEEAERLDYDGDPEDYALEGGADDELGDVYSNPGPVLDLE